MRAYLPLLLTPVVLVGCSAELPLPVVRSISPDSAYNGEDTLVTIEGLAFYPAVEVDARAAGEADLNAGFSARLMTGTEVVSELAGTGLIDFEHLQAVVPAGIDPGVYALEVEGPTGKVGRMDAAFTVTNSRADRLDVDVDSLVYEVFDTAWVQVQLVDTTDQRVPADLAVVIDVSSDASGAAIAFETAGLEAVGPLDEGTSIRGQLGSDGQAQIGIRADIPGTTVIRVSPEDPLSSVADGEVRVLWEPGAERSVDIELPDTPFTATAGVPFTALVTLTDQFGNPVFDASEVVLLQNACETWVDAVTVSGTTPVQVLLRGATGTASCGTDALLTISGPEGASDPLNVRPGPVDRFDVVVNPGEIVAGAGELNIFITPVDRFGNLTQGNNNTLTLSESSGEALDADCVGTTPIFCTAAPTVAGEALVLSVTDSAGVAGTSNAHRVLPAEPVTLGAAFDSTELVAGEPGTLRIDARDRFGNIVGLAASDGLVVTNAGESVPCAEASEDADEGTALLCTFTEAQQDLVVDVEAGGLQVSTPPVDVVSGPLSEVVVQVDRRTAVAGEALTLTLLGQDAFGNAVQDPQDPVLQLADSTGTLSVSQAVLGGTGGASVSGTVTRAGDTRIVARQAGVELGQSAPVRVVADAPVGLALHPVEPWAFTNESVDVVLTAVDSYGNLASSDAMVSVERTLVGDTTEVPLADGEGVVSFEWASAGDELLVATAADLQQAELPLLVATDCGEGGPVAVMDFSGSNIGRACADADDSGVVTLSLAGSAAGSAGLDAGVVAVQGEVIAALTPTSVPLATLGQTVLTALVRDASGCGDEVSGAAWLGRADGTATGPLPLSTDSPVLAAGGAGSVLTIDGAMDCAGNIAVGEVFVRSTRGDLVGAQPTGAGLALVLDAAGDASVTLDASQVTSGGAGTVVATTATGSASSVLPVAITGDMQHPRVVQVTPSGNITEPVDTIVLTFDEPLLATSVVPANFRVDGPESVTVAVASLASDGRTVTLTLDPPVQAALGRWAIVATRDVRDLNGNRLDGTYTEQTYDFTIPLGAVPEPGSGPVGCAVDTFRLRPDGDDGAGDETDGVTLSWSSEDTPLWWVTSVTTASGQRLRTDVLAATEMQGQWWWDGRDDSGRVVADALYTLSVDARDENGNHLAGCEASVSIDNEAIRER